MFLKQESSELYENGMLGAIYASLSIMTCNESLNMHSNMFSSEGLQQGLSANPFLRCIASMKGPTYEHK